ncbi:ABC-F family ATP-binding cassette domain-containing protein [Spiroplasma endosymbiont of Crioceris asparagi]|uniref:ABC-F family ATP-binding cassette domain-containing protein n=1 Tax=Spiroplasma endosymbiont of Crioceris asparagi TaxID=3066286 RepID=UPI0030D1F51D
MGLVYLKEFSHSNGGKKLYDNATLRINRGEHIALIGPNGCGKTTLFNIISGKVIPDKGDVEIHPRIKMGFLDQHLNVDKKIKVIDYLKDAFKELFNIEEQMTKIYEQIAVEYNEEDLMKALKYQDILNNNDFDLIDKKIGNLVNGLGIGIDKLDKVLDTLSGGQKAKIMLAKLLLTNNDVFLLDEPTNFLDITQVEWLAKFLSSFEKPFILISHDVDFINKTCKIIYAVENFKLERYVGDYNKYLEESALKREQYEKTFTSQQKEIKKLETYIAKNAARASTAKSAQSRAKKLEKMDMLGKQQEQAKPKFSFSYKKPSGNIVVKLEDLEIGYDFPLVKKLNFVIRDGEKYIISGKNGAGKTTFLNTLFKEIKEYSGKIEYANNLKIEYFRQIEKMEEITPIQYLLRRFDNITDQDAKSKLSQFGIKTNLMFKPMTLLSGGEQAKVRLSALSLTPCSLLLLDEPTNHIDVLAKESLIEAIQKFQGTIILTTHDINLSTNWANEVIEFNKN